MYVCMYVHQCILRNQFSARMGKLFLIKFKTKMKNETQNENV